VAAYAPSASDEVSYAPSAPVAASGSKISYQMGGGYTPNRAASPSAAAAPVETPSYAPSAPAASGSKISYSTSGGYTPSRGVPLVNPQP